MPKATATSGQERVELKSAPPDGYVILKRMTYGQKLERVSMATEQLIKDKGQGRGRGPSTPELEIRMMQRTVTEFEFKHCIAEHNLEDDNGKLLDFSSPRTLDLLDPRIGDEISTHIENMNNFEDEAVEGQGN